MYSKHANTSTRDELQAFKYTHVVKKGTPIKQKHCGLGNLQLKIIGLNFFRCSIVMSRSVQNLIICCESIAVLKFQNCTSTPKNFNNELVLIKWHRGKNCKLDMQKQNLF